MDLTTPARTPYVETLRTMLDCGKCYADAPQAEIRAGTFDATCTVKHRATPPLQESETPR